MPAKLSYSKFATLLSQNGYITSTVYYVFASTGSSSNRNRCALFFECQLPKTQKSILIHVPSRYVINLPTEITPRAVEIVKASPPGLTERSISYLLEMRGPLIEADLSAISSDGICYSKFSGEPACYFFASNLPDEPEEATFEDLEEADEIGLLEQELSVTKVRLEQKGVAVPAAVVIESPPTADRIPDEKKTEPSPPPADVAEGVELVFEDDDVDAVAAQHATPSEEGEEDEEGDISFVDSEGEDAEEGASNFVDSGGDTDDETPEDEDNVFVDSEDEEPITFPPKANVRPPKRGSAATPSRRVDASATRRSSARRSHSQEPVTKLKMSELSNHVIFEELDVHLGVIYVTIDINLLHKEIRTFEVDAIGVYEQIDDNEKDMRNDRVIEIKKQLELAAKHLELRVREIQADERGLRYQLLRLTAILQNAENLKHKVSQRPSRGAAIVDPEIVEIDRVYNKTRKTVHDMNVTLLHQRDDVEDLLVNYEEGLRELFEL